MPSRRDGLDVNRDYGVERGGCKDTYELADDNNEDENSNPATASGKMAGVTVGKRRVVGGSEPKKQLHLTSLFARENKKNQAARLVPAGLVNLGNACYINSVVQVLINMPSLMRDVRDLGVERLAQHLPAAGVWAGLRTTADKLHATSQARTITSHTMKPAVKPSELRTAMRRLDGRWRNDEQQDAHEFLMALLGGLQSEVLAAEAAATGRRRMPLSETHCPVARNLSGRMRRTWTCERCKSCTDQKETFSCLFLQLPPQGTVNLQDLVLEYFKVETIEKNCDGCSPSAPVPHKARHHFWCLPRVLVLQIKRYKPLPQKPQLQPVPQQVVLPSAAQRQEALGWDAGGDAAPAAADEPKAANDAKVSGTSTCDEATANRGAATAAGDAGGAPVQPSAAGSSHPPLPAPYEKVHTEVVVASGLDLAPYCDAAARAHAHLLEGLSTEAPARRAGDGTAAAAAGAAYQFTGAGGGGGGIPAGNDATPAAKAPGNTAGGTQDTAGGDSTCPSPSFLLQEPTVQQNGLVRQAFAACGNILQRALTGSKQAATPGCRRLRAPESECGTSAVSTGAQADAGDGALTPHGGVGGGPGGRPRCLWRPSDMERRPSPLGIEGGAAAPSALNNAAAIGTGRCGQAGRMEAGEQPVGKDARLGLVGQATLMLGFTGIGMGNDRLRPSAQPPSVLCSGDGGGGGGGVANGAAARFDGAADAVACSERKAPRPMGSGAFFGSATRGAEPRNVGGDLNGSLRRNSASGGHQQANDAPIRPPKRMCVEVATATPTGRQAPDQDCAAGPAWMTDLQLKDLTEDEQFQLAVKLSLCDDATTFGGADAGGGIAVVTAVGSGWEAPIELQDESQGGTGQGGASHDGARAASSGLPHHGGSGGENQGEESDCSADHAYPGRAASERRHGARCRKRRASALFRGSNDLPEVAESPAVRPVPPSVPKPGAPSRRCFDSDHDAPDRRVGGGNGLARGERAAVSAAAMDTYKRKEKERKLRSAQKTETDAERERVLKLTEDGAAAAAASAAEEGAGCSTPKRAAAPLGPIDGPMRPLRQLPSCGGAAGVEDGGGRGGGMDALLAAVGQETEGGQFSDAAAAAGGATQLRRPQSPLRGAEGGGFTGAAPGRSPFGFMFSTAAAEDGAGAGTSAGASAGPGLGLRWGAAGSVRDNPLDLTGDDDDEDVDLNKAIMLSMQTIPEANDQDVTMLGATCGEAPHAVMGMARGDAHEGVVVEPRPVEPQVELVQDSEYVSSEDEGGKGDKRRGGAAAESWGTWTGTPAGPTARSPAAGGTYPTPLVVDSGKPSQRRRRSKGNGGNGAPAADVPLSQLARYRLHGVVLHEGLEPSAGHYVADVLVPSPSGQVHWYKHDDHKVSQVAFERVREDAAKQGYLFFFVNQPPKLMCPVPTPTEVLAAHAKPLPDKAAEA